MLLLNKVTDRQSLINSEGGKIFEKISEDLPRAFNLKSSLMSPNNSCHVRGQLILSGGLVGAGEVEGGEEGGRRAAAPALCWGSSFRRSPPSPAKPHIAQCTFNVLCKLHRSLVHGDLG